MKPYKHLSVLFLMLLMLMFLIACSNKTSPGDSDYGKYYGSADGAASLSGASVSDSGIEVPSSPDSSEGTESGGSEESDSEDPSNANESPAGLLTAAEWNDNKYFDYYKTLFAAGDGNETDSVSGKFSEFTDDNWGFNVLKRVSVTVKNGSQPVAGASVECKNSNGVTFFYAKTGADGTAYLFPDFDDGSIEVKSGEAFAVANFDENNRDLSVSLEGNTEAKRNKIQIMFLIDITGSMGDEHNYLKTELKDVIGRVAKSNDSALIELALLFYRDNGDKEKFAYYDFTDVTKEDGLSAMISNLSNHAAHGGGDYPEAVDEALDLAVKKNWDSDSTTKLIFHLLDAPAHSEEANKQLYSSAVISAADKGIRICPILASGADQLCEYIVRQAAAYTGGSFIFITDHSGIGGDHLDPDLPNAVIEKLNDLLVRVISGYHTGVFEDPVPWNANK